MLTNITFTNGGLYSGGAPVTIGMTVTTTSPAFTGTVLNVLVTSGTWGGGNANGTIVLQETSGTVPSGQYLMNGATQMAYVITVTEDWDINNLLSSAKVSRSISGKMYTATFTFSKTMTGGPLSSMYWNPVYFWMPDYSGTWNLIFLGIIPSGSSKYVAHDGTNQIGDDTLTAYGYEYYLTHQYLPDNLLTLPNRPVIGTNPGEYMTPRIYILGALGDVIYPSSDGLSPPTYTWTVGTGGKWIYGSGINPWKINAPVNPYAWGSSGLPTTEFTFNTTMTKAQAIEKICQYTRQIFYVRWANNLGVWTPAAWVVDEALIDDVLNGLDLPALVQVTNNIGPVASSPADGGHYLASPVEYTGVGEDQYNFYTVRCQSLAGGWIQNSVSTMWPAGTNPYDPIWNPTGTDIKREYYEENPDISTQTDCDNRTLDLQAYYKLQVSTWKCTFKLRSDLVLYQRLQFAGYTTQIPDGYYRIIDIEYNYANGGATNEVTVSIIPETQFKSYLNLKRVYTDTVYEIQNIVNNALNQQKYTVIPGLVISLSNYQPIVSFNQAFPASNYSFVVTGAIHATVPSLSLGTTATITGISGTTVTFTAGGNSYTGTCNQAGSLTIGNTGSVIAINAQVVFQATNGGSGKAKFLTGYTNHAQDLQVGFACLASPDSNGNYFCSII